MSEGINQASVRLCARYAQPDARAWLELEKQLRELNTHGFELAWSDRIIGAADPGDQDNDALAQAAHINLLLVSPALLDTPFSRGAELRNLIQAHEKRKSRLIPVLLEAVDLRQIAVEQLSVLPSDATPVNLWPERIHAFEDIASGIRKIATGMRGEATVTNVARTASLSDDVPAASGESDEGVPSSIGRYRIKGILGEGTYGRVYLASDSDLHRDVAIKVPHAHRVTIPSDVETYLREARLVAKLDHPNLVPVYDLGYTEDGRCYVVSKLIEGKDLRSRLEAEAFSFIESARLISELADALDYAHKRDLVHRDIKPANILIDDEGNSFVADFGLAIREEDFGKGAKYAGTPAYMSPEQARGEGHRVDARSDVFSLGVVLYEMITGRRAFRGDRVQTLLREIATSDARPPRQIEQGIPRELERICLKAIANRLSDRYTTAADLAEDLRFFIEDHLDVGEAHQFPAQGRRPEASGRRSSGQGSSRPSVPASGSRRLRRSTRGTHGTDRSRRSSMRGSRSHHGSTVEPPVKIVPKGLRPFDGHDSSFFLELLPGSRDRNGIPETIRSWKNRIERRDTETPFSVGLIYGPSGCGKSSFVRAGLIPLLDPDVVPLFLEASASETEAHLHRGLHARCRRLAKELSLVDAITAVRRGEGLAPGEKLLIVIDQFEQWLHCHNEDHATEALLNALRQCDGHTVQALLLVRVDYMMGIHRFMQELDVRIEEGRNASAVDLFDKNHARKVLAEFGHAYECFPEGPTFDKTHKAFLNQAVDELAEDDKVVPVHLSVFAEMLKGRQWDLQTLKQLGGSTGIGIKFLEETFESVSAPMPNRLHEKAARSVLQGLMPPIGTDIRSGKKSYNELKDLSGYADRPEDFEALVSILDRNLRLITPTDPKHDTPDRSDPSNDAYELTHDYLVPSLRDWLTRKQRETRRGRAEIRLEERAAIWLAKPQSRHLPSLWEYVNIRWLTRRSSWTQPQQRMMQKAARYHGMRVGTLIAALAVLVSVGSVVAERIDAWRDKLQIDALVTAVQGVRLTELGELDAEIEPHRSQLEHELRARLEGSAEDSRSLINFRTVMLNADDGEQYVTPVVEYLIHDAKPDEIPPLRQALEGKERSELELFWDTLVDEAARYSDGERLRAAAALAVYDPSSERWKGVRNDVAALLVSVPPSLVGQWVENFAPLGDQLNTPLRAIYLNTDFPPLDRTTAADLLSRYAPDDVETWGELLSYATNREQINIFVEKLRAHDQHAHRTLEKSLSALLEQSDVLADEYEQTLSQTDELTAEQQVKQSELAVLEGSDAAATEDSADAKTASQQRRDALSGEIHALDTKLKQLLATLRASNQELERLAIQTANLATGLLRLEQGQPVWPLLAPRADQRRRSYLIHRLGQMSVDPALLADELKRHAAGADETSLSIRRALMLGLGLSVANPAVGDVAAAKLKGMQESLLEMFRNDPDPGIHGAARWLLVKMGRADAVYRVESNLRGMPPRKKRWYIDTQGHTMVIFPAEKRQFVMGSPISERGRERGLSEANEDGYEQRHLRLIDWGFAVSAMEVTVQQYLEFDKEHAYAHDVSPELNCPVNYPSWYDAALYCNWLSAKEGIPEDEFCYIEVVRKLVFSDKIEWNLRIADNFLERRGYRLLTEPEWEYVCRAGSMTSRHYGETDTLLEYYAWYAKNSHETGTNVVGAFMPNDWGMFDMYGNVAEWCHDLAAEFGKRNMLEPWPDREVYNGRPPIVDDEQLRAIRGRGYNSPAARLRSSSRDSSRPGFGYHGYGFRVAKSIHKTFSDE